LNKKGVKITNPDLTEEEKHKFYELLFENRDLLVSKNSELPGTDFLNHEIHIAPDAVPIRQRQYKHSPKDKVEIQRQADELLKAGIVQRSNTPWISPIILVRKPGTTERRMCVDLRKINVITSPRSFPLPKWETIVKKLASARSERQQEMENQNLSSKNDSPDLSKPQKHDKWLYSNLDMRSGYYQQKLHPNSTKHCGFESGNASYELVRCPFGLRNAPALFAELIHLVTHKHAANLIAFLDDILIYSSTVDLLLKHLKVYWIASENQT
jgi:hypothetical protein